MSITYGDKSEAQLRTLLDTVQRELASITPSEALHAAWDDLVKVLALGPAPDLRACPTCNELGMRTATRCSRCWSSLTPA